MHVTECVKLLQLAKQTKRVETKNINELSAVVLLAFILWLVAAFSNILALITQGNPTFTSYTCRNRWSPHKLCEEEYPKATQPINAFKIHDDNSNYIKFF